MKYRTRPLAALAMAAAAALAPTLAACSDGGGSSPAAAAAEGVGAAALAADRTPIDVRTPEEHAAGHVADTLLIDIQAADFEARVAELDPEGAYVVYCRSGNRSAQAVARMRTLGLDVVDGGAFADMAAAGWATA